LGAAIALGVLGGAALLIRPMDWHVTFARGDRPLATASVGLRSGEAAAQSAEQGLEILRSQSKAFVSIAKQVLPSVVSITSERTVQITQMPGGPHSFRFFGDDFMRFFDGPGKIPQKGSGSGVIVSRDGYILTNNHVVREADEIQVTLEDGRTLDAELVGTDPKSDVAVIRIHSDGLVPAKLGDSDGLEVGEWVLAVGNPFQLSSTVTAGIVSAVGRSNIGLADYEDFIQTDAAINPGNSGGALVNLEGEVVGINTAIATRSGASDGVGFAIPINMASRIMDDLIHDGKVVRGWLGVNIQNLNQNTAEIFGLDRPRGALIGQVVPGSPADEAGLRQGDLILELDGRPVRDTDDLQFKVVEKDPGTSVRLTVLRDGREKPFEVRLGELQSETESDRGGLGRLDDDAERSNDLGLGLQELTRDARRELDVPPAIDGVLVTVVEPGKPADKAGLQRGDVIRKISDREILSIREFQQAIREAPSGKPALFLVWRAQGELFLGVRIPE
jgi:serine protease Do